MQYHNTYTYDYESIKQLAAELGKPVTDLLALARQNDPFYTGTPADWEQARWFKQVWDAAGYHNGVHLRRVHYWCVSQSNLLLPNGQRYENTDKCWKFVTQASKMARYLGLVKIQDIVDRKNPDPYLGVNYNWDYWGQPEFHVHQPQIENPWISTYGFDAGNAQPYHLEVWCEKSTMNDVLEPVCSRFHANLCTFEGEVSITAVHNLMGRIDQSDRKPTRILYISDFDPAGNSMPVATSRKIEWMIRQSSFDYDVKLRPLALTADQVQRYALPRTPIKESEKRAGRFEEAFGVGAVELDALEALHAGELGRMVRNALRPYFDVDAQNDVYRLSQELQDAVRVKVDAVVANYQEHVDALKQMGEDLASIEMDCREYAPEISYMRVDEDSDEWLFDSEREYEDQIDFYKRHKNGDAEE